MKMHIKLIKKEFELKKAYKQLCIILETQITQHNVLFSSIGSQSSITFLRYQSGFKQTHRYEVKMCPILLNKKQQILSGQLFVHDTVVSMVSGLKPTQDARKKTPESMAHL